jgi:hypothetical protein
MITIYIDDVPYTVTRTESSARDLLAMAHDDDADEFDIVLLDEGDFEVAFDWTPYQDGDRFVTKKKEF